LGRRSDFESGDMKRVLALIGLVALAPAMAQAASPLTFYPTRDALNAAYPGLSLQKFTNAELYDEPFVTQANPLDHKTNDAVFKKGSILPGLTIRTLKPGLESNALLVYGGGPVGTISVGNYWFGDTLELSFPLGVQAVGENVFGNTSYGTSFAGKISAQFFHGKTYLGGKTFTEASGAYLFIGASSSTLPITSVRISWQSDGDANTYVSDIAFK
jgi:hypothetical protein